MKALVIKEFKQGRTLLFFALGWALVIALCYHLVGHVSLYYRARPEALNGGIGWAIFCLPIGLAFFAAAGLLATESDRGTMPVLLALPMSRGRIWLGKALGGLALAVVSSAAALAISMLLAPRAVAALPLSAYAYDLLLWMALAFGTALFATALVNNTVSALGFAILLSGGIAAGAGCMLFYWGAPLLWNAEAQDVALWCALMAPAFLFASAVALKRGELLESPRKWAFAAPALLATVVVSILLVCGVTRFATRYQRSAVTTADAYGNPASGVLPVLALADPLRDIRDPGRGWYSREELIGRSIVETEVLYRRNYVVALDLRTGRELLHERIPASDRGLRIQIAASRDSHYLAVVRPRSGLTWGARMAAGHQPSHTLDIFDLTTHQRFHSDTFAGNWDDLSLLLSWSPSGKYLLNSPYAPGSGVQVLRPDATIVEKAFAPIGNCVWSPTEDVLFGVDPKGNLHRLSVPDGSDAVIWARPHTVTTDIPSGPSVSPDGRWVLVHDSRSLGPERVGNPRGEDVLLAIPARGGKAVLLWRCDWATTGFVREVWSADGKTLYLVETTGRLFRWQPGSPAPIATGVTIPLNGRRLIELLARPERDEIVMRVVRLMAEKPIEKRRVVDGQFLVMDARGAVRESPVGKLAKDHFVVGFDPKGRVILQGGGKLVTADLDTGDVKALYP